MIKKWKNWNVEHNIVSLKVDVATKWTWNFCHQGCSSGRQSHCQGNLLMGSLSSNNWQQTHTCGRQSWQIPHTQYTVLIILYFNLHTVCNMRCNHTLGNVLCQIGKTTKNVTVHVVKSGNLFPSPVQELTDFWGVKVCQQICNMVSKNWYKIKFNKWWKETSKTAASQDHEYLITIDMSLYTQVPAKTLLAVHIWDVFPGMPT